MIEPRPADESIFTTLSRAKDLIESRDFDSAALVYFQLLDSDLTTPLRGEVLTNLGAALCVQARAMRGPAALARLDQARDMLVRALPCRQRAQAPAAWATTRANLALVHLARHDATGNSEELLSAHLALDGIEQALRHTDETALRDWVAAIRDQLLELQERRSKRR
jgi:hypothetical protein